MSSSSKQRAFINRAIFTLTQLGCKVTLELNKHYKIKIEKNSKIKTWAVSCTPHNRYTAQRDAISDLRKILLEIGAIQNKYEIGDGMLQMMTDHKNINLESLIDKGQLMHSDLFKQLLKVSYPNLTDENLSSVMDIQEILNLHDFPSNLTNSSNSSPSWNVISDDKRQQSICSRNVLAIGGDVSARLRRDLRLPNALSVSNAMNELFAYYKRCQKLCKLGVLITDCWRPSEMLQHHFEQHIETNELLGIQTIAILKSSGNLYPITWPWR
jgi:hypothetical protein